MVILGWSDKIIPIIQQLSLANESEGGGTVAILAPLPKLEMTEDILQVLRSLDVAGTNVVIRSGSPLSLHDIRIVSATTARCVIVLSDPTILADESDALVMRTVLTLDGEDKMNGHLVVEA